VDEVEFGRYRLIDEIGSGGMGKVYRARDTILPRDVAIKVLPADRAEEPGYQDRFRREAHIAARLTEPNILAIYDAGEINGRLFLVMPVIDGIDLGCWLQRHQRMPPRLAVGVIEQLASALDAAHAVGLVHRDVKPSNALMTPHEHVYLIDFGIAHDAAATKLTATGSLLGSLPYMAPERLLTSKSDARSDVYSLACTFYECLTGERPYADELVIAGHLSAEPPRPSAMRADVFAGFDDVIACGIAKDPDQRFQTAGQLAVAARRALESSTTGELAKPPPRIPEADTPECENTQRLPEPPDLHNAETLAAPTVTSQQTEPRRTRRRIRIAIGAGLLSAAVVLAVAALLAPAGYYSCKGFGIYPYCGPNGELDTSTSVTYWIAPQQHQMLTALAAILLTAGVLVLLRSRWWTYILALVAGYGALLMLPDRDINYAAFLSSLLLPTAICVLIGWAITRRGRRSQAAAARGPRTTGQMPRL
jgi:predicted Ser/Thr protein kinase